MRRSWPILVVVTAALALVALVLSATAVVTSRTNAKTLDARSTKTMTLAFTNDYLSCNSADLNPKESFGDELVCRIRELKDGADAGRLGQVCEVLDAKKPPRFETTEFLCLQTIELKDGQINGQGLLAPALHPEGFQYGITGGTGAYSHAEGYAVVSDDARTLTLHLENLAV